MVVHDVIYSILLINLLHEQFVFLETNVDQQGDINVLAQKQQDRVNCSRSDTTMKNINEEEINIHNAKYSTTKMQQ